METNNPDLSQFKILGSKMIIWHDLDVRHIAPKGIIQYYNNVLKNMGVKTIQINLANYI